MLYVLFGISILLIILDVFLDTEVLNVIGGVFAGIFLLFG